MYIVLLVRSAVGTIETALVNKHTATTVVRTYTYMYMYIALPYTHLRSWSPYCIHTVDVMYMYVCTAIPPELSCTVFPQTCQLNCPGMEQAVLWGTRDMYM